MRPASTAKTRWIALNHFEWSRCKADDSNLSKTISIIFELIESQVLKGETDINERKEIQEAARRCLQRKTSAEETRRKDLSRTPRGSHAVQAFSNQVVFMLSQCIDDMDPFLLEKLLRCTVRREKWVS